MKDQTKGIQTTSVLENSGKNSKESKFQSRNIKSQQKISGYLDYEWGVKPQKCKPIRTVKVYKTGQNSGLS